MPKLKHTLADLCVAIGMNQEIELQSVSSNSHTYVFNDKYGPYKQEVLAVLTEDLAYFPESRTRVQGEPFYDESQVICPTAVVPDDATTPKSATYRRSLAYVPGAKRVLPFSNEVIQNLPMFCFPSGGHLYKEKQTPQASFLVLTNMEGARTYAACVTITRPIMALETQDENGKRCLVNPSNSDSPFCTEGKMLVVYAPLCICLLSSYPYFMTLKDCISSMLPHIEEDSSDFWRSFINLAAVVTKIPVAPSGPLAVEFHLFGVQHIVQPADEADRRVIDVDLHLPLMIFKPDAVVLIVTCLLTQQRMVFMSSSYALLTLIIETFLCYIDPIKWRQTYVPILPNSLGDLMESPGLFIMGVHSSLKSQVKQVRKQPDSGIVLVDIDKGLVDSDDRIHIPKMPDIVAQSLLVRLKKLSTPYELQLLCEPTLFSYEELKQQKRKLVEQTKAEIKDAFLDMLVSLFGDIFKYMSVGEQHFDKKKFIDSRHEDERKFFNEVMHSDAVERFVEERLENYERRDAFAVLGERMASQHMAPTRSRSSSIIQQLKRATNISPLFDKPSQVFSIPIRLDEGWNSARYYSTYRDYLTQMLEQVKSNSIQIKASYLYLRGFAHISCGDPIAGLRDFHALYSSAPELYPKEYAMNLITTLDQKDLDQLQSEEFYKQAAALRTFTSKASMRRRNGSKRLPTTPLDKTEFEKRIKTYKLILNDSLIDWLFHVLSNDDQTISPEQFSDLYKVLTDAEKHSANRDIAGVTIETEDRILRVSSLISTSKGNGRIVLTTNVLYFVGDGAREVSMITPLCDIKEIIKYRQTSLFSAGVQALRIINSDRNIPIFYACLKDERDVWLLFLNEMAAGHKSSIALRDSKMVDIAVNNIVVAHALLEMNYPVRTVEGACFFVKKQTESVEGLSEDTKDALEMRLDPCVRESKRTTVMCIAFVPGSSSLNESPSIWCGMGSGAIMVYETDKWNCVSELRYAKNRVSCLFLNGSYIWAGSFDTVIYVINTETRKSEQQLQNHTDFISDIISQVKTDPVATKKTFVWSSSYNGQLVCWNPDTRECVKSIMLKKVKTLSQIILVNENNLWCVAADKIMIVDPSQPDCPVLQKLIVYDEYQMPIMLEYALLITPSKLWVSTKLKGGGLYEWNTRTFEHELIKLSDDIQICCMVCAQGSVWVGNKDGRIILLSPEMHIVERELHAHTDVVKSICETEEGHVISGSSSKEGKLCVWNSMMGFEVIDGKMRRVNKKVYDDIHTKYEVVDSVFYMPNDSNENHY